MKKYAAIIMLFFVSGLRAEVNYRTGNYYLEMLEFVIPTGGKAIEIKKIYNSRSTHTGAFGFGWSFNFDIKLEVLPGGFAQIIDEDGRKILLHAKNSKDLLEKDIKNLTETLKDSKIERRIRKMNDPEAIGKVFKINKVEPYVPFNTLYMGYGGWRGYETLKRLKKGWIRTLGHSGEKQLFDTGGKLIKLLDPNGNFVFLKYRNNRLYKIVNPFNAAVTFSWNKRGFLNSIRSIDGRVFKYEYSKQGTLTSAVHSKFGVTRFEYDSLYNLVKITYPTGDTKSLTYDRKTDMVATEKGPGLLDVRYDYGTERKNKKHYWTIISVPYGKKYKEIDRWEYWEDEDKYARIKEGSRVITKFSKFGSGNPEYIDRDGKITRFKYNSVGQPVERILPDGGKIITQYNRRIGKPRKVTDGKDIYYYSYNKSGNISHARNNHGLKVAISYDPRGRIKSLKNNRKGTLFFEFNALGKPTKIIKKGLGTVTIWYDSDGKIINIKTKPKGGKIAPVIISTFTELFGLLKYAGI